MCRIHIQTMTTIHGDDDGDGDGDDDDEDVEDGYGYDNGHSVMLAFINMININQTRFILCVTSNLK